MGVGEKPISICMGRDPRSENRDPTIKGIFVSCELWRLLFRRGQDSRKQMNRPPARLACYHRAGRSCWHPWVGQIRKASVESMLRGRDMCWQTFRHRLRRCSEQDAGQRCLRCWHVWFGSSWAVPPCCSRTKGIILWSSWFRSYPCRWP